MNNIINSRTFCSSCRITQIDALFFLWITYSIVRGFMSREYDSSVLYPYYFIYPCYVIARFWRNCPEILFVGCIMIGCWQAILVILQYVGWLASNHNLFTITGSFGNPGPLGGFLAVCILCTIGWRIQVKKKIFRAILLVLLILQLMALILSDSRAGWLAVIGGTTIIFLLNTPVVWEKIKKSLFLKIGIGIFILIILLGMYLYRPLSANGRILIWKVSADMIVDAPIFGHGIGSFGSRYMHCQAKYFEQNPQSAFVEYADNVSYPYNEFLHIGVEQGIVGLLLFVSLIAGALLSSCTHKTLKGVLVGFLIFASFSYPSYIPGLLVLFPVVIGSMQSKIISWQPAKSICVSAIVLAFCAASYVAPEYLLRKQCLMKVHELFQESKASDAELFLERNYSYLMLVPNTADIYAQYVVKHEDTDKALAILTEVQEIAPTAELCCDIGDLYKEQGNLLLAKNSYEMAYHMVPRRFLPRYKLFVLFRDAGDSLSACKWAKEVLTQKLPNEGTWILRMKSEARGYLEDKRLP